MTYQPTNKAYLIDITLANTSQTLPTRWRRKPVGIDMELNYVTRVTVILCISNAPSVWLH